VGIKTGETEERRRRRKIQGREGIEGTRMGCAIDNSIWRDVLYQK
jgi:hypothetical protein